VQVISVPVVQVGSNTSDVVAFQHSHHDQGETSADPLREKEPDELPIDLLGFRLDVSSVVATLWYTDVRWKPVTLIGFAMPTALRVGVYRFYSYDCGEPRHMHVDREHLSATLWLDPDVRVAENYGYGRRELRDIEHIPRDYLERLRHEWDLFCTGAGGAA
jgi:Domain of unknown function (DUF4160)